MPIYNLYIFNLSCGKCVYYCEFNRRHKTQDFKENNDQVYSIFSHWVSSNVLTPIFVFKGVSQFSPIKNTVSFILVVPALKWDRD